MNNKRKGKFITYCGGDFEDIIIAKAFDGIKKGFYIDVGANHPVERNVTKHFYDNGWNGINIEPLKKEYELLAGERPNDINLNMGLADKKGALEFYLDGGGTSCAAETIKNKDPETLKKEKIPVETMTAVLDKHAAAEPEIHLCKIDVEGFERKVLEGLNFQKYRPVLFCIESVYPGTNKPCHKLWEDILLNNDYGLVFDYGSNRYYADKKSGHYKSVLKNLNTENVRFADKKDGENASLKTLKCQFKGILKFFWKLLPRYARIEIALPLRLKLRSRRLRSKLNMDSDIIIYKY